MNSWKDKHKRKGLVSTISFHLLLLIAFLFLGMTYEEPKPEEGIAINFGNTLLGSGDTQPTNPPTSKKTEIQPDVPQPEVQSSTFSEDVITQEITEAPTIENQEQQNTTTEEETEKEEEQKQVEKELSQAFENFLNSNMNEGQGNTDKEGDEGSKEGEDSQEEGKGGWGNQDQYMLGNRGATNKPKYIPNCNETGRVVVEVRVNKLGLVTIAEAGVKGSTNTHPCLLEKAKEAALKTTFEADHKATPIQLGKIVYYFSIK